MATDTLLSALERIVTEKKISRSDEILKMFRDRWPIEHVCYVAFNLPYEASQSHPYILGTYSLDWQKRYTQQSYIDVDPIIRLGLGDLLPTDWADLDRSHPMVRKFFGEAQELDVGKNGITVPIRGRKNETAVFSVTSNLSNGEWQRLKPEITRDLFMFSFMFHSQVMESIGAYDQKAQQLSQREANVLRWKALGKTDAEIGDIVGITARTVRFHLETARAKLNATNTFNAVARAVLLGAISLTTEPSELLRP